MRAGEVWACCHTLVIFYGSPQGQGIALRRIDALTPAPAWAMAGVGRLVIPKVTLYGDQTYKHAEL